MKVIKSKKKRIDTDALSEKIIEFIQEKKGKNIISLNLENIPEAVSDYFIICNADSTTQVQTITDNIEHGLVNIVGLKNIHTEGRNNAQWAIIDTGDILIHIFQTEYREYYNLEGLWSDGLLKKYENI